MGSATLLVMRHLLIWGLLLAVQAHERQAAYFLSKGPVHVWRLPHAHHRRHSQLGVSEHTEKRTILHGLALRRAVEPQ